MATRKARLMGGGPFDGTDGEVVALPLPDTVAMGGSGGFVYRLRDVVDGVVRYTYDRKATAGALTALGIDPASVAVAVKDDRAARTLQGAGALDGHDVQQGITAKVEVLLQPDGWECHVNGVLVEKQPRGFLHVDDTDGVKAWGEAVVHALAQEATKAQEASA